AREPLVHLQDCEASRAQHDEDEPGRRCLREQGNQRRQTAQRLGYGEERQQARRQLSRRLHLPHGALLVAVDEKDGPDTQSERQQTPVAELMQARQDAHEVPPVARQNLARLHLWDSRYSLFRVLTRDGWLLFLTRCTRLFAYGALSVVLVFYLTSLGLSTSQTGVLLTLTLVGDTLVSLYLTTQADRIGRRRMLIVGAMLMAAAGLAFASTRNFAFLVVAGTIGVISPSGNEVGPFLSIEQAALSQVVPGQSRTAVFAWYTLVGSFATAAGALAGGTLSHLLQKTAIAAVESYRVV